jgi:hypothetical protein
MRLVVLSWVSWAVGVAPVQTTSEQVDTLAGEVTGLQDAAKKLVEGAANRKAQLDVQLQFIKQNSEFPAVVNESLSAIHQDQAEIQDWRDKHGDSIASNKEGLEHADEFSVESRKYVKQNKHTIDANRAKLVTARDTDFTLRGFLNEQKEQIKENRAWMEENKRLVESNAKMVAEAQAHIENTKEFLRQNTAKVHANKYSIKHNAMVLKRHSSAVHDIDAQGVKNHDQAHDNQVWMERNRNRIQENARFVEENEKFLEKQGEFITENKKGISENEERITVAQAHADEEEKWVGENADAIEKNRNFIVENREAAGQNRKWVEENMNQIKENKARIAAVVDELQKAHDGSIHNHALVQQLFSVWNKLRARLPAHEAEDAKTLAEVRLPA